MRLNILIGGKAGQGINELSVLIGEILSEQGYYVFNYRDYGSFIRGGHNFNILCVSERKITSFDWKVQVLVALDNKTLEIHKKNLDKSTKIINLQEDFGKSTNMLYAASLLCYLGIDKKILIEKIKQRFDEKWWKEDINAAEKGYCLKDRIKLSKAVNKKRILMNGGYATALSLKKSGLNFYFAYPMTPATNVLHYLSSMQDSNLKVIESFEEIEAVNASLGANYAGKLAMTGSSGGGFDLMTEALSFQGQSEIPLTVYLASRPGPSTGVPTYSMQQDFNLSIYSGHGEFPRVVLVPGDVEECYTLANKSLELSEKFSCLTILLSDKDLAEYETTLDKLPEINKIKLNRKVPGKEIVKVSSYEHLQNGDTIEDAENTKIGMEKRIKKTEEIKNHMKKEQTYKVHGDKKSKNIIISAGSTKGAILDYLTQEKSKKAKFIQLLCIEPFPDITHELNNVKEVYVVELNSTGQLSTIVENHAKVKVNKILKYDGRPFTPSELKEMIK